MTIDNNGINLITTFEGFSAKPYPDPGTGGEPYTIGYGSTFYCDNKKVTLKDQLITKEQAKVALQCYINKIAIPCIQKNIKIELNQHQINALACFVYNIGCGNFAKSSVARFINTLQPKEMIEDAWRLWNKGGGKVLPGLVKRREAEILEYFK